MNLKPFEFDSTASHIIQEFEALKKVRILGLDPGIGPMQVTIVTGLRFRYCDKSLGRDERVYEALSIPQHTAGLLIFFNNFAGEAPKVKHGPASSEGYHNAQFIEYHT